MSRLRLLPLVLVVLLLPWACTDADKAPVGPSGSGAARLVMGATFEAMGGEAAQDEIVRIRLTVQHAVTGEVLQEPVVEDVDPDDPEWSIELEVPVPQDGAAVRVLIELLDATGETEWSGLTDPIEVEAGQTTTAPEPTILPGPPGNLSVDSISIAPAADTLLEEEAVQLTADVFGGDPDSVRVVWASLTPDLATVEADGTVTALLPGTASIEGAAGPARDTAHVVVLARVSAVLLAPEAPVLDSVGARVQMEATVVDARGEAVEGIGVVWASGDTLVARHLGEGLFEAVGAGQAEITATVEGEEGVQGAVLLTVRLPDLVPENLVITTPAPDTIVEGDSLGVGIDVRNAGGTGAAASTLALRALDAADPSVVLDDSLVAVPALGSGAVFSFSEVFGIDPGEWPDRVILEAVADVHDGVIESDEANNVLRTDTFVVRRALPDLALGSLSVGPTAGDTIIEGDTLDFEGTVLNVGPVDVPGTTLAVRILEPGTHALVADTLVQTTSILAGASAPFLVRYPLNDVAAWPTEVLFEVEADAADALAESNELNNAVGPSVLPDSAVTLFVRRAVAFVTVTPAVDTIPVGDTARFDAQPFASDETPLDRPVTWEISDPVVATVDGSGLVTAAAAGTAQVLATADGVTGSASVVVRDSLPTGFTKVWTGESGTDWATAGNWNPAGAPGSADTVLVPASAPVDPVLVAGTTVAGLTVEAGAALDLGGWTLTIAGDLHAAGPVIDGGETGELTMTGTDVALSGTLHTLFVVGTVHTAGAVDVTNDLDIEGESAILAVGPHTVTVGDDFRTGAGGALAMDDPAAVVDIGDNASFSADASGSTSTPTAGLLIVGSDFYAGVAESGEPAFVAGGNHRTVLEGTGPGATFDGRIEIAMGVQSQFQHLDLVGEVSVDVPGDVVVGGDLDVRVTGALVGNQFLVMGAFHLGEQSALDLVWLFLGGSMDVAAGASFHADNTSFFGTGQTIQPGLPYQHVSVDGQAAFGGATDVAGNLVVSGNGRELTVGPHAVVVGGSLVTQSGGILRMEDPAGLIDVNGVETFFAGGESILTAGTLRVAGDFFQGLFDAGRRAFRAGPGFHTIFDGGIGQEIAMQDPGSPELDASHFGVLDVVNGSTIVPASNVFVTGDLTVTGGSTWSRTGHRMHAATVSLDPSSTADFAYLQVDGAFAPDPSWMLVFDTLQLSGTGQTVPGDFPMDLLRVSGTAALAGATSVGEISIFGPGAELDVAGQSLTVTSHLTTTTGGVLRMQSPTDTVSVGGSAVFSGGSTTGLLTAGVLRVSGDFMQTGAADAFAADGGHTTEFDGSVAQAVSFASPGAGLSHFGRVLVTRPFTDQVMFSTDVRGDTLEIVTGSVGIPAGTTASFTGDVSAVGSNLGGPGRLEVGGVIHGSGDSILGVGWLAVAGGFDLAPGDIPADTVVLRGTAGQPIDPTVDYQHLVVEGTTAIYDDFVASETLSSLVITGSGAHFSPGACQTFHISGLLRTENGGVLEMNDGECDDEIDVHGDAEFFGGSTAGTLISGILRVRGNFTQGGDPASFAAGEDPISGDRHTVRLGGTAPQTVTFSNPGTSRFHHLEVDTALATPTLGSDAVVGGNLTVFLGTIDPGIHRLDVLGDLQTTGGIGGGTLTMSAGIVDVGGNAVFAGESTDGSLTGGLLVVRGGFTQSFGDTISTTFAASGSHVTRFAGPPESSLNQLVSFASPGSNLSRFHHLQIRNAPSLDEEVRLEGDVHVGGSLDVGVSDGSIASNLNLVTGTTTVDGNASIWPATFTNVGVEAMLEVRGDLLLDFGATIDNGGVIRYFGTLTDNGATINGSGPEDGNQP